MISKKGTDGDQYSDLTQGIGSRLRTELERLNLKADFFSDVGKGYAKGTIYAWARGDNSPPAAFLSHAADAGMDVQFIVTGKRSESSTALIQDSGHRRHSLSNVVPAPAEGDAEDTVFIDLLSATGSMGPGNELLSEDVVMGRVPFSRRWLSQHLPRSRPTALKLVHAYGDSMKGTLESGDFGIVDTDMQTPDVDGVYVLQAHNRLFIKRVTQRLDGSHVVTSDNPLVTQTDILNGMHEVRICGRIVYGWNGRRL